MTARAVAYWLLFAGPGAGAILLGAALILLCSTWWLRLVGGVYVASGVGAAWVGRRVLWA